MKTRKENAGRKGRQRAAKVGPFKKKEKKSGKEAAKNAQKKAAKPRAAEKARPKTQNEKAGGSSNSPAAASVPISFAGSAIIGSGRELSADGDIECTDTRGGPDIENLLRILADSQRECILPPDLPPLLEKIRATARLWTSLDAWDASPERTDHRGYAINPATGFSTTEYTAWTIAAQQGEEALSSLAQATLGSLLHVIKNGEGGQAARALGALINALVVVLNEMKMLLMDERKRPLFQNVAKSRLEFPSLISIFTKENLHAETRILRTFKLGHELPFKLDPRKPSTAQTRWAMNIVMWIDREKSRHTSAYRRVAPDLGDFCTANAKAWDRVIKFHLDYFQSPGESRWKKWLFEYRLEDEEEFEDPDGMTPAERYRHSQILHVIRNSGPVGDITTIAELKKILAGYDLKKIANESGRYNILKSKVTEAASALMS